jgi:hypothetical protein
MDRQRDRPARRNPMFGQQLRRNMVHPGASDACA